MYKPHLVLSNCTEYKTSTVRPKADVLRQLANIWTSVTLVWGNFIIFKGKHHKNEQEFHFSLSTNVFHCWDGGDINIVLVCFYIF